MAHVHSDIEQIERAKERTAVVEAILHGAEHGATAELEKISLEAEARLKERAEMTGSKPAGHVADVLKAQRLLVSKKDLGDRFLRIAKRLEELRLNSSPDSPDVHRLQKEIEALRPLLRLTIRSDEFRSALISALRVGKHVLEQNVEGSLENVLQKGEKEGVKEAGYEAQKSVFKTFENIEKKAEQDQDIISDSDWEKLSDELDDLFRQFQRHGQFRKAIPQLFDLASTLYSPQATIGRLTSGQAAAEGVQEEAKELVAQFSGTEELDALTRSINHLSTKLERNPEALKLWAQFKEHVLHVTSDYKGKQDVEKFRVLFREGFQVFKEHKGRINKIIDRMSSVISNIANDQYVTRLRESLAALSDDLFWRDQDGNRYFDAEAAGVLAASVSDVIRTQFKYLALPKVEKWEHDTHYSFDNLVISATLPDKIDFHLESFASLDTSEFAQPGHHSFQTEIYLTATMRGIKVEAPNIHFTYDSNTISESGIMSVSIPDPGAGLSIDFVMRPVTNPSLSAVTTPVSTSTTLGADKGGFIGAVGGGFMRYEFVRIKSHFAIPDMEIEFDKKSLSHRVLVPLITALFKSSIIDKFESGVEESLDDGLIALGQQVTSILNQAPNPLSLTSFGSMLTVV